MHTWIRSMLILVVALGGVCFTAWAEDMSAKADKVALPEPLVVEKLAEVETRASSGPKSTTDKIAEKFMALDVDASDGVSMDEYITMVQQRVMARFAAMDADADGEVSEDEYRIFWKSRMAKWYRLQR